MMTLKEFMKDKMDGFKGLVEIKRNVLSEDILDKPLYVNIEGSGTQAEFEIKDTEQIQNMVEVIHRMEELTGKLEISVSVPSSGDGSIVTLYNAEDLPEIIKLVREFTGTEEQEVSFTKEELKDIATYINWDSLTITELGLVVFVLTGIIFSAIGCMMLPLNSVFAATALFVSASLVASFLTWFVVSSKQKRYNKGEDLYKLNKYRTDKN